MSKGIATVKKIRGGGTSIDFEVRAEGCTDEFTVSFNHRAVGEQKILGLERLFGCNVGDRFHVTVEIYPPRTSTLTHLVITAFNGPAKKHDSVPRFRRSSLGLPPNPKSQR